MLRCADGSLYTGIATDVPRRVSEHERGKRGAKYLRGRGPFEVVYQRTVGDRSVATKIEYYLLLMRAEGEEFDDAIYIEINENQFSGHDLIQEARMTGNMLTLELREPVDELDGASEIVLTYDDSPENRTSIETGAFRVLGNTLAGGNA